MQFASGARLDVFVKDLSRSRLPKDSPYAQRERECCVYQELLEGQALGTPQCYGVDRDEAAQRHRLLLEYVDATPLGARGFDSWLAAAAWLGRMQGRFMSRREQLLRCDFLQRYDADYYRREADRAAEALRGVQPELTGRLAEVIAAFRGVIPLLGQEPETLVHGSFRSQNILVGDSAEGPRICPIDWELAGIGRAAHDLGFLCDGFRSPRLEAMLDAYGTAASTSGLPARDPAELGRELDGHRLYKTIRSLSHWRGWKRPSVTLPKVLDEAEALVRRLS